MELAWCQVHDHPRGAQMASRWSEKAKRSVAGKVWIMEVVGMEVDIVQCFCKGLRGVEMVSC